MESITRREYLKTSDLGYLLCELGSGFGVIAAVPPSPEVRTKVLEAIKAGEAPMDVARKFRLSILTVAEIAAGQLKKPLPKPRLPPLRNQ